jgi:hypothetical protein
MQVLNADTHPKTIDFQTERFVRLTDFEDSKIRYCQKHEEVTKYSVLSRLILSSY